MIYAFAAGFVSGIFLLVCALALIDALDRPAHRRDALDDEDGWGL